MAKDQTSTEATQEIVEENVETTDAGVECEAEGVESISLVDLNSLAQIIDLASSRGAFRGNELEPVGALFNKLTRFLASVQAAQDEAAANAEGGETPVEAPAEAPEGE